MASEVVIVLPYQGLISEVDVTIGRPMYNVQQASSEGTGEDTVRLLYELVLARSPWLCAGAKKARSWQGLA